MDVTESAGLPVAAYAIAAGLDGHNAGMIAGFAAIWLRGHPQGRDRIGAEHARHFRAGAHGPGRDDIVTGEVWLFLLQFPVANLAMGVLFTRTAGGPDPLVARLAAEVVALRLPAIGHPGLHRFFQRATWLWAGIFLALTAALGVP